jgi:small subunit ribosomal protein S4
MARYTGPKRRLERREGVSLFGNNKWQQRPGVPGDHPFTRSRPTEYATQLREVQKTKRLFGLLEKQFRLTVKSALKSSGNTGTRLLQLLELRLDNVVYRMGLAKTRSQARQFVTHRHVKVNGKILNIPSALLSVNDTVEISSKLMDTDLGAVITKELEGYTAPEWVSVSGLQGKVVSEPKRPQMEQIINERLIIEFYSR